MRIISRSDTLRGKVFALLLLASLFFNPTYAQEESSARGSLVITFTDVGSTDGSLRIALYTYPDQWTDNPKYVYTRDKRSLENGRITITIENIPQTTYALAVLDDLNDNGDMDYRVGIPREGWGMSRNPSFLKLKAPGFEKVSFDLDGPVLRMDVKLNYILGK